MQIYKFTPYLKSVIWGGERIAACKGIDTDDKTIGESWEISGVLGHESEVLEGPEKGLAINSLISKHGEALIGRRAYAKFGAKFPILIKIIDAARDLSVQVHPNDDLALARHKCLGKSEMWYVLDADPDAKIYSGLSKRITKDDYKDLAASGRIMEVVAKHASEPGDIFFLPAGRIHSIGAGNFLVEIQETSDITYRIYDFGRRDANGNLRELHTDLAMDAIDYNVYDDYKNAYDRDAEGLVHLADCDKFKTYKLMVNGRYEMPAADDSFAILICIDGECRIEADSCGSAELKAYETALVPACAETIAISGAASLLVVTL